MDNYIDIGIDFGAENIVVIAVGHDNKGRTDYKLVNLDGLPAIKNYIAQRVDETIDIGIDAKTSYVYNNQNNEYKWVSGRYKSYILEENTPGFAIPPELLLRFGLTEIIEKIESFDFSTILSGKLHNLTVGIPQSWDTDKKNLYKEIISVWKHGNTSLLSEPVAATIASYKRSSVDISDNIIMILDIGASTFDISFSEYSEADKKLNIYKTNYRSDLSGHYFDLVFAAFTLINESNKIAINEVVDRVAKIKLRKVEDYIKYLTENQEKYSTLLLELENIKENSLSDIVKFNRKKLIDLGKKYPITVNKQIYQESLDFYANKISNDINKLINNFKNDEKITKKLYPFLCGGASSLYGLEKSLKDKMNNEEGQRLFSIIREGQGQKIDITIATGLAYYANDNSIISKKLDYSISTKLFLDDEKKEFILFDKNSSYPLANDKSFSELLNDEQHFEYHGEQDGKIEFPLFFNHDENINEKIISFSIPDSEKGDSFDLFFNIDADDLINIKAVNKSKNKEFTAQIHL